LYRRFLEKFISIWAQRLRFIVWLCFPEVVVDFGLSEEEFESSGSAFLGVLR
jgi:hypothetical protein